MPRVATKKSSPTTDKSSEVLTKKPAVKKPAVKAIKKITTRPRALKKAAPDIAVVAKPHVKHVKHEYLYAVGRRKEAIARVRWYPQEAYEIIVNDKPLNEYFPTPEYQRTVQQPLVLTQHDKLGKITARVQSGGKQGQADSVRLGIARILVKYDADLRLTLKQAGFLRRDPRVKERKKYGLKRARRAPQWQKR